MQPKKSFIRTKLRGPAEGLEPVDPMTGLSSYDPKSEPKPNQLDIPFQTTERALRNLSLSIVLAGILIGLALGYLWCWAQQVQRIDNCHKYGVNCLER